MPPKSNSEVVKKKMSLALVKAKIVRFLMGFDIEDGIIQNCIIQNSGRSSYKLTQGPTLEELQ